MIIVPRSKYKRALEVWLSFRVERRSAGDFIGYLNMPYPRKSDQDGFYLTKEAAHKVEQLCGPHAQTILRAWLIRQENAS